MNDIRRWIQLVERLKLVENPTEKDAPTFKGGKQNRRDGWGIIDRHPDAKKIKKWWHREKNVRANYDLTTDEAEDIIADWEQRDYDYD